ncbi:MAG: DNA-3-methyladenine glycosylase I [Succinivibrionaceae bacterium]|nr:DNA-3-methyladenine glycosylase I [Succinivibrionaceae bacterium]
MGYCSWADINALERQYHDQEWGVPVRDDRILFEHLSLECLQCGLSWDIVLKKRELLRKCFDGFDIETVSGYTENDVERILQEPKMIRSIPKIRAIIGNAICCKQVATEFGSFSNYIWSHTGGKTALYRGHDTGAVPSSNGLSLRISRDLKKRGFKYVGPVTIYSMLQACGIINDHDVSCPCRQRLIDSHPFVELERDQEVR